jgi:hypothetical protein
MKNRANIFLGAITALYLSASVHADDQDKPFFGGESDVAYAIALWTSLEKDKLVGENAINVFPFKGNQPHGAIQQVLDTRLNVNGTDTRVIVKRNHGGEDISVKSIYADPVRNLKAITVMAKREPGYDQENLDWFWVKFTPDGKLNNNPAGVTLAGRIGKGASTGCIACHKAIGGKDLETLTEK